MDYKEGYLNTRPRRWRVVPGVSSRTLHHPSFQPLYMAAAFVRYPRGSNGHTDDPTISPAEIFYTDPTAGCRIPNFVTELGVIDSLQLSTPPPVMSACLAPPNQLGPFRSGSHPTRDLGSSEWVGNPISTPMNPSCCVVQLTQEEDQAITNLLKLHYDELRVGDEAQIAGVAESSVNVTASFLHTHQTVISASAEKENKPSHSDEEYPKDVGLHNRLQQGKCWSHAELEAADTLLSCCCVEEEDLETAVVLPVPLPFQHNEDLEKCTEIQPGSETFTTLGATYFTQNDTGPVGFNCVNENRELRRGDFRSVEDNLSVSEMKQMLSDSEGDALCVLLNLSDVGAFNNLQ